MEKVVHTISSIEFFYTVHFYISIITRQQLIKMTFNKKKHRITNKIVRIMQLFFSYVTFLCTTDVTFVAFNISYSHANTNLSSTCFLHD